MRVMWVLASLLLLPGAARARGLPATLDGWRRVEGPRRYSGKQIYDYMDGAAEVHRMYGFRTLRVARYVRNRAQAKVELFDMGSVAGAFGDFTHARDLEGRPVQVGQGGHFQSGVLWFWKGRHLVCLSSPGGKVGRELLAGLGRAVAARLPGGKGPPGLVGRLPRQGLRPRTVRYFRVPAALSYHYGEFGPIKLLGLDGKPEAALADYKTRAGASVLLLVRYPSAGRARKVQRALAGKLGSGVTRRRDGKWRALAVDGALLRLVLEAPSRAEAQRLVGGAK